MKKESRREAVIVKKKSSLNREKRRPDGYFLEIPEIH
jgi:hypothetical protein